MGLRGNNKIYKMFTTLRILKKKKTLVVENVTVEQPEQMLEIL